MRREQAQGKNDTLENVDEGSFFHKRYAEKIVLKNGRVVVKITKLNSKSELDSRKNTVCLHFFKSDSFKKITETLYGFKAINRWNQVCKHSPDELPEDVTPVEFGIIHKTLSMASMTPDIYFLRRKASFIEKKLNLQSN